MRRTPTILCASTFILILVAPAFSESGSMSLQSGDALPPIVGQTLSGKPLELPAAAQGKVAVLIFSFSRAGGHDARNWAQHLSKNYPALPIYNIISLDSVPRPFRSMVVSGIRAGMPAAIQDRTVILYQQQSLWEKRLRIQDESSAVVLVLGPTGHIREIVRGPFAGAIYDRVLREISRTEAELAVH